MSSQGHARAGCSSIHSVFPVPSQRQGSEQQTLVSPGGSQTPWPDVVIVNDGEPCWGGVTDIKSRYLTLNCGEED